MVKKVSGKVDFLDLVSVHIGRGVPTHVDPHPIEVNFEPLDRTKNVIFDENALKLMNAKVSEKIKSMQLKLDDSRTFDYIKEFVGRLTAELYRHDLVGFEDVKEAKDDPYSEVRNKEELWKKN